MKTGLWTMVSNAVTHKKYSVSTIEGGVEGWQTAVFRKKFGLFANYYNPELCFLVGLEAERAADHHNRVVAIVRDVDPANWDRASHDLAEESLILAMQALANKSGASSL
jgi:hypothetical protein